MIKSPHEQLLRDLADEFERQEHLLDPEPLEIVLLAGHVRLQQTLDTFRENVLTKNRPATRMYLLQLAAHAMRLILDMEAPEETDR